MIFDKKNIELIRFAKCNTVDYSSEEDNATKKDLEWRDFIGALRNFSTIVQNAPNDPIDRRLIQVLFSESERKLLYKEDPNKKFSLKTHLFKILDVDEDTG